MGPVSTLSEKLFVAKAARCDLSTAQVIVHTYKVHFCLGHSSEGSRRLPNRPAPNVRKLEVAIIGAGVIGLAIAWRLAARGASVQVFDRGAAGAGASHAAAGMLAACAEAQPGDEALGALGRESQARWPPFAAQLLQVSGVDLALPTQGPPVP